MNYVDGRRKLVEYRKRIEELRADMRRTQESIEPVEVEDYVFESAERGRVRLSQLYGARDHLFVIHNMGASCPYCTLWADGFSGVLEHLRSRAAFVVSSPDPPEKQAEFAASRGWKFPMVSVRGSTFSRDMGYRTDEGWLPGVSVFRRDGGRILRVSDAEFRLGDDFCGLWHLFDLIPEGAQGWEPRFCYPS